MCLVPYGKNIKTNQQFRNLVTAIILRQEKEFTYSTIVRQVQFYSKGSKCKVTRELIKEEVMEALECLNACDYIVHRGGVYRPNTLFLGRRNLYQSMA